MAEVKRVKIHHPPQSFHNALLLQRSTALVSIRLRHCRLEPRLHPRLDTDQGSARFHLRSRFSTLDTTFEKLCRGGRGRGGSGRRLWPRSRPDGARCLLLCRGHGSQDHPVHHFCQYRCCYGIMIHQRARGGLQHLCTHVRRWWHTDANTRNLAPLFFVFVVAAGADFHRFAVAEADGAHLQQCRVCVQVWLRGGLCDATRLLAARLQIRHRSLSVRGRLRFRRGWHLLRLCRPLLCLLLLVLALLFFLPPSLVQLLPFAPPPPSFLLLLAELLALYNHLTRRQPSGCSCPLRRDQVLRCNLHGRYAVGSASFRQRYRRTNCHSIHCLLCTSVQRPAVILISSSSGGSSANSSGKYHLSGSYTRRCCRARRGRPRHLLPRTADVQAANGPTTGEKAAVASARAQDGIGLGRRVMARRTATARTIPS